MRRNRVSSDGPIRYTGMQSGELIATDNSPVWDILDRLEARTEAVCGAIEVTAAQILELVEWGEQNGDKLALQIGKAFLKVVGADQESVGLPAAS